MGRSLAFLISVLFATAVLFSVNTIGLLEPKTTAFEGEQATYGNVGPGQTFTVQIDPIVRDSAGNFLGQWDTAEVISLPEGWSAKPSKIYDNPLIVEITAEKNAPEGDYLIQIDVNDEKGQENIGGDFTFWILVTVRHDVLGMSITPEHLEAGAGQPARFEVTLNNLGSAKDVFSINATGVKGWEFARKIYLPPGGSKTFTYEVIGNDEASYNVAFSAVSDSSNLIHREQKVSLGVRTSLLSDYKATSHGVLLFPIISTPIYSLAGLIGLLFP
ncbi:MAG: hypothetical protein V1822_00360 [Candidatus Micrarchaeota archaeon]